MYCYYLKGTRRRNENGVINDIIIPIYKHNIVRAALAPLLLLLNRSRRDHGRWVEITDRNYLINLKNYSID